MPVAPSGINLIADPTIANKNPPLSINGQYDLFLGKTGLVYVKQCPIFEAHLVNTTVTTGSTQVIVAADAVKAIELCELILTQSVTGSVEINMGGTVIWRIVLQANTVYKFIGTADIPYIDNINGNALNLVNRQVGSVVYDVCARYNKVPQV